jgi:hypothetical protein
MSNTSEWVKRLETHRYSLDERALQYKFEREIKPKLDTYLSDPSTMVLVLGTYDLESEPWREFVIQDLRKYNLKIYRKEVENLTEITLRKIRIR